MNRKAVLITMPWDSLVIPSIQLGILKSVLAQHAIQSRVRHFNLTFAEFLMEHSSASTDGPPFDMDDYAEIANHFHLAGLGDWLFSVPPFRYTDTSQDEQYLDYLRYWKASEELIARALWIREQVPSFIDRCVDEVLSEGARVVAFTTTFCQNVASLLLAKALKEQAPNPDELTVVFGGANCEGPMGVALHRSFPWVDIVVRGEGEKVFPALLEAIFDDGRIRPLPGLCFREDGEEVVVDEVGGSSIAMDEVPIPDYDDYFSAIHSGPFAATIWNRIRVPFESARGCWWGAKHHCTFCGLNGATMAFRSKSAPRLLEELVTLSKRYQRLDFEAVDNIIDMRYFKDFLPALRDRALDLRIFFETKANLSKEQVRLLRDAGVRSIQPGIESLNTPILKLMKKGVTALQNIRLLKWCAQYGIRVAWSIIYGFPGEPIEGYAEMAQLIPSITHLPPPYMSGLVIDRFSPYHQRPVEYGIEILGPRPDYPLIYPLDDATLNDLAYKFNHRLKDGGDPENYVAPLRRMVEHWQASYSPPEGGLYYRRGEGFLIVTDERCFLEPAVHTLTEPVASIFLACDAGATPAMILETPDSSRNKLALEDVSRILETLCELRLLFEEDGSYLSLALPVNPD